MRHAETSAPDHFHGAESDVGLGARGRSQAEAVARLLTTQRPHALYSSAMRRAVETARAIGRACGLVARIESGLHERRMGPLSGVSREEGLAAYVEARRRWMAGEVDYTHEGGESFAQIQARVVPIWERIVAASLSQTIVVVAHGVVIRVLLTTILDDHGPADFDKFPIDNTALNDLRWDGSRWRAVFLNQRIGEEFDTFAW
jgi:broad specificity phosphatase PhoE